MQKARRHNNCPEGQSSLRPIVSTRFQVLLTRPLGVLFTFPSRYLFTIGHRGVFSLAGWCRLIQTGFLRPRLTQDTTTNNHAYAYRALTCCGRPFQNRSTSHGHQIAWSYNPAVACNDGLGSSRFARHYFGNHYCFLFLPLLRCFSSGRSPPDKSGSGGCPIRKSADHSFFAAPRGLSQLCTSFFASRCQGIHHVPFGAFVLWPAHARVQHRPQPPQGRLHAYPF